MLKSATRNKIRGLDRGEETLKRNEGGMNKSMKTDRGHTHTHTHRQEHCFLTLEK